MEGFRIALTIVALYGFLAATILLYTFLPHRYWAAAHLGLIGLLATAGVAKVGGADDARWALTLTLILVSTMTAVGRYGPRYEVIYQEVLEDEASPAQPAELV